MRIPALCILLLVLGAALAVPGPVAAEGVYPTRVYTTAHTGDRSPTVDGKLDDPAWDQVEWASDFVQWEPEEGAPPSQQTRFKILYDDHALYIAYQCYEDDPALIDNHLARRDWFPGDWVEINIDSYHDQRTAFSFTSSVSGTRGDEFVSNDGNNWDGNWDPVWELHTRVEDDCWTAEVRIPFSQLRYADAEEQVWGIQVQRRIFRKEERSVWQPKSKDESGWVSRFGELRGIRGLKAQRQVEILPYTVARTERFESVAGDPFRDGSDSHLTVGVDGKVGVTSDLTLDFTVNPDFGQVEADPSEVNLSAFETFFQEKRPFFIEGSNILSFQIAPSNAGGPFTSDNLFYSRRIGLRPHHFPELEDGAHADVPENTSILGAFKLTGKTRNGLSVGVMNNMTAREEATIDVGGVRRRETVEPFTNFFVGRAQQDIHKGDTRIGAMVTSVHRNIDDPQLAGIHRRAYSGGIDFFQYWKNREWFLVANVAASRVEGEPEAILATQTSSARYYQRPDNDEATLDSTRTSLDGHAGSLRVVKGSGTGPWRFETGVAWRSPGFEINDIGFLRRADEVNQFSWVGYSIRDRVGIFRRFQINANQWTDWDFGGTNLSRRFNLNGNAEFTNNGAAGAGITRSLESTSNTALRGGPAFTSPGSWTAELWGNSDRRSWFRMNPGIYLETGDENSFDFVNPWVDFTIRPSNALQLTVSPFAAWNDQELQYITTRSMNGASRYLFGTLEQKTAGLTLRVDYTLSPNLTLQFYGSPFVSTGKYTAFKRITDPRADAYRDRFQEFAGSEIAFDAADGTYAVDEDGGGTDYIFGDPNFNFREFNSNLILRWEFQPGSLLYLVWSQSRVDLGRTGVFDLGDEAEAVFDTHPRNILLLKISKWFSL